MRSNHEYQVLRYLEAGGLSCSVPSYTVRRQWSDRVKSVRVPLIPGYMFFRPGVGPQAPVVQAPGVIEIVHFGGIPGQIPESEIMAIEALAASGKVVGPWPFLRKGDRVLIERGVLAGLEGILVRLRTGYRLVVSVEMLQRSVAVEVERDWIRPVTAPPVRVLSPAS